MLNAAFESVKQKLTTDLTREIGKAAISWVKHISAFVNSAFVAIGYYGEVGNYGEINFTD